jgi:CheY-like chemotaxis protein
MKPLRILVAEDNPINQKLAASLLRSMGHTGVMINDGLKALQCLKHLQFDLVLMDITMPHMDGLEALRVIREREREGEPHLPVIIVTAHDLPGDGDYFLSAGADGYVAKPISEAALRAEIERVLSSTLN